MTRRGAVIAHFDPDGRIAPHVRRMVDSISSFSEQVVFVSTSDLLPAEHDWATGRATVLVRPNVGHDFVSYREGIRTLDLTHTDELVVCNDTAVFTDPGIVASGARSTARNADFWGITPGYGFTPHLQSYFIVFGRRALESTSFARFWDEVEVLGSRDDVITSFEVGLSAALRADGLHADTVLRPTRAERAVGSARAHSHELTAALQAHDPKKVAGWVRRTLRRAGAPEWNSAAALADRAVRAPRRLPAVKISTLRDDPYGLDSRSLLSACERRFPEAFAGVREYLDRTDPAYGGRWAARPELGPKWSRYRVPTRGSS